jgi:hypothetical protein
MQDAGIAAAGGHIDTAIGLYTDVKSVLDSNKVEMLAYTGTVDVMNKNMLATQFKISEARELTANYAIFASKEMPQDRYIELHKLLARAQLRAPVVDSLLRDQLNISTLSINQSVTWYNNERIYWQKQVEKLGNVK